MINKQQVTYIYITDLSTIHYMLSDYHMIAPSQGVCYLLCADATLLLFSPSF